MHALTTNNKMTADTVVTRVTARLVELSNGAVIDRQNVASTTTIKAGDRVRRTGDRWALMETK